MSLLTEQLSSAAQNQFAAQIAVFRAFSQSAFGGLEKLIALNFNLAKQSFDNANTVTHELLAIKEPQEILAFSRAHSQPQLDKILSYGRELASITSDTRAELWQAVSSHVPAAATSTDNTVAALVVKTTPKKPAVAKPIAAIKQLPLLAEPEAKPAVKAKTAVKPEIKPVAKASAKKAAPINISKPVAAAKVQPAAIEKTAEKKISKKASLPNSASTAATPATITATPKKSVSKPSVAPVETAPAAVDASSAPEKKSAVKFPFPVVPKSKAGTPAFPNTATPAYKAKSSSATGAKKRVRQ